MTHNDCPLALSRGPFECDASSEPDKLPYICGVVGNKGWELHLLGAVQSGGGPMDREEEGLNL